MPRRVFDLLQIQEDLHALSGLSSASRRFFFIVMQTHTHTPGPKETLLSRKSTTGTTKHFARGIGIMKKKNSAVSSREQRKKNIPNPIDMGERAARYQNFTRKEIINWNAFDCVSVFVHRSPGQEKDTYTMSLVIRRWKHWYTRPKRY